MSFPSMMPGSMGYAGAGMPCMGMQGGPQNYGMAGAGGPDPFKAAPAKDTPPPPSSGGAPTMEEITRNPEGHCSGQTISDQEVKVQDPSGRPLAQYSRYAKFEDAPFPGVIQDALKKAGFPAPSQIQQYCWPLAMEQKDVIGVAATGSGKTISFLLPAFATIIDRRLSDREPSLCVIAPTRELAIQIQEEADKFGKPEIRTVCCYGGAPKPPQADQIRRGVHGVIGTPGRINDFVEGGQLDFSRVCKLVLDEADRMLDMGFEPQIRKILNTMPRQRHTMFFTATWPQSVRRLANEFLDRPYTVTIGNRDELKGNQDITQSLMSCRGHEKNGAVMQILRQAGVADRSNTTAKALVFCQTKRMCDQLTQNLERNGVPCAAVHGDKGQREREAALGGLKENRLKLLVATDVAARGLDIKGVTLVINYDPPTNTEDYVHRIGRTGRAGQKGHAVALVSERDTHALRGIIQVMKRTNQNVTPEFEDMARNAPAPPPSGRGARGPPPVITDPNFRPGLSTGTLGAGAAGGGGAASAPMGGSGSGGVSSYGGSSGGYGGNTGGSYGGASGGGYGGDSGGSRGYGGRDTHGGRDSYGGGRDAGRGGDRRDDRGRRDSPPRRRRSPSRSDRRRRRSPSQKRRRSPSRDRRRRRRSPSSSSSSSS